MSIIDATKAEREANRISAELIGTGVRVYPALKPGRFHITVEAVDREDVGRVAEAVRRELEGRGGLAARVAARPGATQVRG